MAEFVLVHGAWHGGWCWHKVRAFLEEHGDTVWTPDLPGHGDDPADVAEATLDAYVDRILDVVGKCSEPPVLVGHSMGGIVIARVAEEAPEQVDGLVYVAAFVPEDGETMTDLARRNSANALRGNMQVADDGVSVTVPQEIIAETFYHDCEDEDVDFALERLRPQNIGVFNAPVTLTQERYGQVSRQFIECIEDQVIHIALQRWMARRAGCLINTLNTSHSPFFSAPAALAAFIARMGIQDAG